MPKKGNIPWNKGKKGVMPTPWNKGKTLSAETKLKISNSLKGIPSPMKGKKMSEESRKKMSEAWDDKRRQEQTEIMKERNTKEFRRKSSERMRGKNNPMYGMCGKKHHTFGKTKKFRMRDLDYYDRLHDWVRKNKQQQECEFCGVSDRRLEWANINEMYDWKLDDFISLCSRCHIHYDKAMTKIFSNIRVT